MTNDLIRVCGPKDKPTYDGAIIFNVTSSSTDALTKFFSPFFMGPVKLYGPYGAFNMENAWQYSKVYAEHCDDYGPTDAYWDWAFKGWAKKYADRYPMGRGAKPEYSLWDGRELGYIEARKRIYIPLYEQAVPKEKLKELKRLVDLHTKELGQKIWLFDYDGYDNVGLRLDWEEVVANEERKMGHAFVLAELLKD